MPATIQPSGLKPAGAGMSKGAAPNNGPKTTPMSWRREKEDGLATEGVRFIG
jgi:hypothetical protein